MIKNFKHNNKNYEITFDNQGVVSISCIDCGNIPIEDTDLYILLYDYFVEEQKKKNKKTDPRLQQPAISLMELGRPYYLGELQQVTGRKKISLWQILERGVANGMLKKEPKGKGKTKNSFIQYTRVV